MSIELVVAVIALLFTFYQAWLSRHHNKLSVEPHLQWSHERTWTNHGLKYRLVIQNHGLGPARFKDTRLFLNGTSFDSECDDPLRKILQVALNDRVEFQVVRTSFPGKNYALKVNSEYVLVEINFPKITRENVGDLEKLDFNRLDARVEYESFYGDSKVIDTRDSVHD